MRYLSTDTPKPISKIGLGTWQFGSPEWNYPTLDTHAIVRRAVELGVTLYDTAEIYGIEARSLSCRALVRGVAIVDPARIRGFGHSERILGDALVPYGNAAFVATKFYPAAPVAPSVRLHAAASPRRLRTPTIDLYQVHHPGRTAAVDRAIRALRDLQHDGLIAEVGISNGTLDQWQAAEEALGARVTSNQLPYSLVHRSAEQTLLPYRAGTRPRRHRLQPARARAAVRPVRPRTASGETGPAGRPTVLAGELGSGRGVARHVAGRRARARRHSRADCARLGHPRPRRRPRSPARPRSNNWRAMSPRPTSI